MNGRAVGDDALIPAATALLAAGEGEGAATEGSPCDCGAPPLLLPLRCSCC